MKSEEIRSSFLDFFKGKGHLVLPGSSLVPRDDPTLLFTSAGMVQFKPYFLGTESPPAPRLATCQKCFRMSDLEAVGDNRHLTFFEMLGNFSIGDYFKKEAIAWAWEYVTQTLGLAPERLWATIYSDDEEAYALWKGVGVPEGRIRRFGEEDNFWGPVGGEGPCGPCSEIHYDFGEEYGCGRPDCQPNCKQPDCPRFLEIWNLVFVQFNQDRQKGRTPLAKKHIDTGAGLERLAAAVAGKPSVYETDLFWPLIEHMSLMATHEYQSHPYVTAEELASRRHSVMSPKERIAFGLMHEHRDRATRIVVEHARGLAFLLADGVMPSDKGRGNVVRRLLHRAALFGRRLDIKKPFLMEMVGQVIGLMGPVYPELNEFPIRKVVGQEEERFSRTLEAALVLLNEVIEKVRDSGVIPGEVAFQLHDTYGLDLELTRELARERGLEVDTEGFEREMERQRERARAAQSAGLERKEGMPALTLSPTSGPSGSIVTISGTGFPPYTAVSSLTIGNLPILPSPTPATDGSGNFSTTITVPGLPPGPTVVAVTIDGITGSIIFTVTAAAVFARPSFVGHEELSHLTLVGALARDGQFILPGGKLVERAGVGEEVEVVLAETPFYGEKGGQVGDTGEIIGPHGRATVTDTFWRGDIIFHRTKVTDGFLSLMDRVEARVDAERRLDIARNHTATHLLQAALRKVLGAHVRQKGSLVAPERLRFDFTHLEAPSPEELRKVEALVNSYIRANLPVVSRTRPYKEALEQGAIALFEEKYGEEVRVLEIGQPTLSMELCGGTHLRATGEIGPFLITTEASIGAGLRRIEALTGRGAEHYVKECLAILGQAGTSVGGTTEELLKKIDGLKQDLEKERKKALALERELQRHTAQELLSRVETVNGICLLSARVKASRQEALREMGDILRDKIKSGVVVLGAVIDERPSFLAMVTPDLVAGGLHAGEIVKAVAQVAGGGGGGRPEMAQAGGKDKNKIDQALQLPRKLLQKGA
ncbi:MAG: alanine--tRNA ligase [Chloroflexi bacterium]|nr:alanine--tRNA ligase [Chloroflexota bacterium]